MPESPGMRNQGFAGIDLFDASVYHKIGGQSKSLNNKFAR